MWVDVDGKTVRGAWRDCGGGGWSRTLDVRCFLPLRQGLAWCWARPEWLVWRLVDTRMRPCGRAQAFLAGRWRLRDGPGSRRRRLLTVPMLHGHRSCLMRFQIMT